MKLDGVLVRRLREDLGLSLTALADAASVSKAHLSFLENDKREASPAVAARLAQALDVAIVDLRAPD